MKKFKHLITIILMGAMFQCVTVSAQDAWSVNRWESQDIWDSPNEEVKEKEEVVVPSEPVVPELIVPEPVIPEPVVPETLEPDKSEGVNSSKPAIGDIFTNVGGSNLVGGIVDWNEVEKDEAEKELNNSSGSVSVIPSGNTSNTGNVTGNRYEVQEKQAPVETFHYALSKEEKYPIFTDTGIELVGNQFKAEDAYNALKEIATRKGGYFIEDKEQVMAVIDGRIILMPLNQSIDKDIFLGYFEDVSVIAKVKESRENGKYGAVEYIEQTKEMAIFGNGQRYDIVFDSVVQDNTLLIPVRDIANAMNADISWDPEQYKATIVKDGKVVVITGATKTVVVNGARREISTATIITEQERLVCEPKGLIELFGYDIEWDAQECMYVIEEKEVE